MLAGTFFQHIRQSFHGAWAVVQRSFGVIKKDSQILIYPYLAIIFIFGKTYCFGDIQNYQFTVFESKEIFCFQTNGNFESSGTANNRIRLR